MGAVVLAVGAIAPVLPILGPGALLPKAAFAETLSIDVFYEKLAPYGSWVEFQGGYVFVPRDTPPGWRPYMFGH
jgi:hypothetical protein